MTILTVFGFFLVAELVAVLVPVVLQLCRQLLRLACGRRVHGPNSACCSRNNCNSCNNDSVHAQEKPCGLHSSRNEHESFMHDAVHACGKRQPTQARLMYAGESISTI